MTPGEMEKETENPGLPYSFEGSRMKTPMGAYDSAAAWYITRSSMIDALGNRRHSLHQGKKFQDLEDELARFSQDQVRVENDTFLDQGTVVTADDGSKMIMVSYAGEDVPEYEFWLMRFTGEHARGTACTWTTAGSPPVASRKRPLDGNMDPPKSSLLILPGSAGL